MKLSIYSLRKTLFEGEAVSVNCKTTAGEVTVLSRHEPMIAELAAGTLTVIDAQNKAHYIPIRSGFIETSRNAAKILAGE